MATETTHSEITRMNDYVGPGIYADVTWNTLCEKGRGHTLGLLSHACTRCGAQPTEIRYCEPNGRSK